MDGGQVTVVQGGRWWMVAVRWAVDGAMVRWAVRMEWWAVGGR